MLSHAFFQKTEVKKPRPFRLKPLVPEPLEWRLIEQIDFSRSTVVEVGCGRGDWIIGEAKAHPEKNYIGIERTHNKSQAFKELTTMADLGNLFALQADAILLMAQKFHKECVDEFYFFYPNPTPKQSQANKRFFASSLFEVIHTRLKDGGQITLTSNIKAYMQEAVSFLTHIWNYQEQSYEITDKLVTGRTNFEIKYLAQGEKLFEAIFKK